MTAPKSFIVVGLIIWTLLFCANASQTKTADEDVDITDEEKAYAEESNQENEATSDGKDTGTSASTKRDESAQAVVQFLDGLANGQQTVTSIGGCAVTRKETSKDCLVVYIPTGECSFTTIFKGLFKDFSEAKMMEFLNAGISRNLIQGNKYSFNTNSEIVVSACKRRKKLLLKDFTSNSVSPVSWLTLQSVTIEKAYIFYGDMEEQENVDDWVGIGIQGTATADIAGVQANVNILKEWKGNQIGDSDVVLSVNPEGNEISVVNFLTWMNQDATALYPDNTDVDTSSMQMEETKIEKGEGALIRVILGNEKMWDAFVTGQASGSSLLDGAKKMYVYCKNGDLEQFSKVSCAVMAKFAPGSFNWGQVTGGFDVEGLSTTRPIVEAMRESGDLYFQSSRNGFENPSDEDVSNEFDAYANIVQNEKNVVTENYVTAEMCLRFRANSFGRYFPQLVPKNPINSLIAHVCPYRNEVRMHFPVNAANAIYKYSTITTLVLNEMSNPAFGIRDNIYVEIKEIKLSPSDVCQSFLSVDPYEMLEKDGAVALNTTMITQCYDGTKWAISGSGKEAIFHAMSDVTVVQKNINRFGISASLNIFDAKVVQTRTGAAYLSTDYQEVFGNLMEFPMKDLRFEGFFNKRNNLFIKGKGKIQGKDNIDAEFLYYLNDQSQENELTLCLKIKNAIVDGLVGYLYNSAAIGAAPWVTYDNVALIASKSRTTIQFDRTFCKNAENSYDRNGFPPGHAKAFQGGILLYAENIQFKNCADQDKENPICKFYQRVFEGTSLAIKYYGQAKADKSYFFEGRFETPMKLGPGIELRAKRDSVTPTRVGKLVHDISMKIVLNAETNKEEIQGRNNILGSLHLEDVDANFPAMLSFTGESILFHVPKIEGSAGLGTNILGVANVKSGNIRSESYPLDLSGPIEEIEFHSRLFIGSVEEHALSIVGGRENTIQYIHGTTPSKNKFYACKKSDAAMKLRNVFAAFGAEYKHGILNNADVMDACFTYHNDAIWNVPNHDIKAQPGLRLYGKLKTSFGSNLPLTILLENNAVEMLVELKPIHWGVTTVQVDRKNLEGNIIKVDKKITRLQLTIGKEMESMGPKLYISYQNGAFTEGYIEGYIETAGFAGKGRINIAADSRGKLSQYEFIHNGKIYDIIDGQMKLSASYGGADINAIEFQLEVDLINKIRELMPQVAQKSINEFIKPHERVVDQLTKDIQNITEHHQTQSTTHNSILEDISRLSAVTKKSKINRARSMQASSRKCGRECKPVHMPGLKWEKKCTTSRKQQDSRCIKFVKDSHKVSDVGCMAQCESERVRSHVEAIHHDSVSRSNIARLADATACKNKAQALVSKIEGVKAQLETLKAGLSTPSKFIRDLKAASQSNAGNVIKFASMLSNYPLIEGASEPECLKFKFGYEISTGEEDTSKENELEDSLCFGEGFVGTVADLALRKAYEDEYEVLQGLLNGVEKEQSFLLNDFVKDITKEGENVQRCIRNAARSTEDGDEQQKRSYIPNASLSPFRSSLFHIMSDRTVLMFNKYSPWAVLEQNDPFIEAQTPAVKSIITEEPAPKDPCTAARQTVQDYQDIVAYIKTWAMSHQNGEKSLEAIAERVNKRLTAVRSVISEMGKYEHVTASDVNNMKHWMNVTEQGMRKWTILSVKRLDKLNNEGLRLMKEELSHMYSNKEYKSIDEYIQNKAKKGNNAFKRAIISETDEKPFSQLSQELLKILKEGESLQGVLPVIEKIEEKVSHADKRSIACHTK
ncbi:uncharacterized protein LOC130622924 isoform X2 [Hydractinia symbiolongicarpus]|uniref:uncharacterized protein LOC130622924 isoform X2 n=1 Tax=Hydractinia symbiolongicarpus TaxID=13093 RepID=UPI0025514F24|nr:uncharacterized protein LOC130622924 isoform X2 [Hydractinia symbiolongicarpus]